MSKISDLHKCDRCNTFTPDAVYVTHPEDVNIQVGRIRLICLCLSCHHQDKYEAALDGGFSTHSEEPIDDVLERLWDKWSEEGQGNEQNN